MGKVFGISGIVLAMFVGPEIAQTDKLLLGTVLMVAGVLLIALGAVWKRAMTAISCQLWYREFCRRMDAGRVRLYWNKKKGRRS